MVKGYKQLSLKERDRVTEMKSEGKSLAVLCQPNLEISGGTQSRYLFLGKLSRKSLAQTRDAVIGKLENLHEKAMRFLAVDNGTGNTWHEEITGAI